MSGYAKGVVDGILEDHNLTGMVSRETIGLMVEAVLAGYKHGYGAAKP